MIEKLTFIHILTAALIVEIIMLYMFKFTKSSNAIKNWYKNLKKHKLEKTIGWDLAIIKKINKFSLEIETEDKRNGIIKYEDLSWTKKELDKAIMGKRSVNSLKKLFDFNYHTRKIDVIFKRTLGKK